MIVSMIDGPYQEMVMIQPELFWVSYKVRETMPELYNCQIKHIKLFKV